MNNYEDIINLSRPKSKYPKMNNLDRASQFAPFAALTGFDEKVSEVARLTDKKIELDDGLKLLLNDKLNFIKNNLKYNPSVEITYFLKDANKDGGKYQTISGYIKRIDEVNNKIYFKDKKIINISDLINIKSNILK